MLMMMVSEPFWRHFDAVALEFLLLSSTHVTVIDASGRITSGGEDDGNTAGSVV
jgi:hypothetical protein